VPNIHVRLSREAADNLLRVSGELGVSITAFVEACSMLLTDYERRLTIEVRRDIAHRARDIDQRRRRRRPGDVDVELELP
jgi:hypothetical protein